MPLSKYIYKKKKKKAVCAIRRLSQSLAHTAGIVYDDARAQLGHVCAPMFSSMGGHVYTARIAELQEWIINVANARCCAAYLSLSARDGGQKCSRGSYCSGLCNKAYLYPQTWR